MHSSNESFEVNYNLKKIKVEPVSLGGQALFKITIPDKASFFITRTKNYSKKFWTSVPEGNQKLAEEIGVLIEGYYIKNN